MFEIPAALLAWLYSITNNYAFAISLIAVLVMILVTPLILTSTRGMLEMHVHQDEIGQFLLGGGHAFQAILGAHDFVPQFLDDLLQAVELGR